ncbi:hypothetical protein [Nitratifractor sp.]
MGTDPFQSPRYREIITEHIRRTLGFLLGEGIEFAVAAEVEHCTFSPELPSDIRDRFAPTSLFVLSGYTFESAVVEEKALRFEAGFGEENFGSVVSIPLLAIKQVIVGEYPIIINVAEPEPPLPPESERSMEALLSNPENRKLLKKKRK